MISCQSDDKLIRFNILHPQGLPPPPRLPLVLICFLSMSALFILIRPGKQIKAHLTNWQRAKTFINKEVKSLWKWRATCWSQTSILHKPNRNESRNHTKVSTRPLAKLNARCRRNSCDCKLFQAKAQEWECSGARCWLNNACLPKWVPVWTLSPERAGDVCSVITNLPIIRIWCKFSVLFSITLKLQGGLVLKETIFHSEDPNSSLRSGKHPPCWSVLELVEGGITLEVF